MVPPVRGLLMLAMASLLLAAAGLTFTGLLYAGLSTIEHLAVRFYRIRRKVVVPRARSASS